MPDQRLRANERLKKKREFERVYERRASAGDERLVVYACENESGHARLGLSVSRRMGGTVKRNVWKRRLREAFRLNKERLPALDLLCVPRSRKGEPPPQPPSLDELAGSLVRLSKAAARRLARKTQEPPAD